MIVLLDMNLSPRWRLLLANARIEAFHWSTLGRADVVDEEILAFAARRNYIILTQDLDFGHLLAFGKYPKPSVIQLRTEELDPDIIGQPVIQVLHQFRSELEQGALITFDPRRTRARILPLR